MRSGRSRARMPCGTPRTCCAPRSCLSITAPCASCRAERLFGGIADILEGRRLNRRELAEDLRARVGSWVFDAFDPTLGQLSLAASYAGVLAYGPPQGSTSTFVRPDHQASRWRAVD